MKNRNRLFALLLSVMMVFTYMPAIAFAEGEEPTDAAGITAEQTDDSVNADDSAAGQTEDQTTEYDIEQAVDPETGAADPAGDPVSQEAAVEEESGLGELPAAAAGSISYSMDGTVLRITGSGAMSDYSSDEKAPWSSCSSTATEIVIADGVTSIGAQAFCDFIKITKVTIPDSVTVIGEGAFYDCSSVEVFEFGAGSKLTNISDGAFANCRALNTLDLPDSVKSIGACFIQNTAITGFMLPLSAESIAGDSFVHCGIEAIDVPPGNKSFSSKGGVLFSKNGDTLIAYPSARADEEYTIPQRTVKIGNNAFKSAQNLKKINFPAVKEIGESAFAFSGLKNVTLPDSVTALGQMAFCECSDLEYLNFGKGIKVIDYRVCYNCTALAEVDLGAVEDIETAAFSYSGLKKLHLPKTTTEIGVTSFGRCKSLESVTADGLKLIGYQAFMQDTALTDVSLNEGLESIYGQAFYGCDKLSSIDIPSSCTFVHELAIPKTTVVRNKNTRMAEYGYKGWVDTLTITGKRNYTKAYQVLDLVNAERKAKGLDALRMDNVLLENAMLRSAETVVFFSHCRPNGNSVAGTYDPLFGYFPGLYNVNGENIAFGSATAVGAMDQWMNSPEHKENILDSDWKTIGIGCFEYKGECYWVQCFGTEAVNTEFEKPSDRQVIAPIHVEENPFEDPTSDYSEVTFKFKINGNSKLAVGSSQNLTLSKDAVTFNPDSVDWVSTNTDIATVSSDGTVTGKADGVATIEAYSRGYKRASFSVAVGNAQNTSTPEDPDDPFYDDLDDLEINEAVKVELSETRFTYKYKVQTVKKGKKKKKMAVAVGQRPEVRSVTLDGKKLKEGTDYDVWWDSDESSAIGKYVVTVILHGDYSGAAEAVYTINPKPAKISKPAKGKKKMTVKWKKAAKNDITYKALDGYEIQYSLSPDFSSADTKTTTASKKAKSKAVKKLQSKQTYYVRIRTYKNAGGARLYSDWSAVKSVAVK